MNQSTQTIRALHTAIDQRLANVSNDRLLTVSIGGPSGSGKSTLVDELHGRYPASIVLTSDNYYLGKTRAHRELPRGLAETFEDPRTMDLGKLATDLSMLQHGRVIQQPLYDMMTSEPLAQAKTVDPQHKKLIIFEGLVANLDVFKPLIDVSVCVTADYHTRLARRIARDAIRNGQTATEITNLFETTIEPAYGQHYRAADEQADFIIATNGQQLERRALEHTSSWRPGYNI